MLVASLLLGFSAIACVVANPTSYVADVESPSLVERARQPAPSEYPLGTPCDNEWKYLNFNTDSSTDITRLEFLHTTICNETDIQQLLARGLNIVLQGGRLFNRWQSPGNKAIVKSVFEQLFDTTSSNITTVVGGMIIDNHDFTSDTNLKCATAHGEGPGTPAYTLVDPADHLQKTHFCSSAYSFPPINILNCTQLDPTVDSTMDNFGRLALHEMVRYNTVGPDSTLGRKIVTLKNNDGQKAYGPERAHGLVDPRQDNQPTKALANADNYAWLANNAYFLFSCFEDFNPPVDYASTTG